MPSNYEEERLARIKQNAERLKSLQAGTPRRATALDRWSPPPSPFQDRRRSRLRSPCTLEHATLCIYAMQDYTHMLAACRSGSSRTASQSSRVQMQRRQ